MKRDTKIRALSRLIERDAAAAAADRSADHAALTARSRSTSKELAAKAAENAWTANQAAATADEAWKAIAKPQREYATDAASRAIALAVGAAGMGGSFSGDTDHGAAWGTETSATTTKTKGDQYSRRCTYRKTNATHRVTITPEGIVDLVDDPGMAAASAAEGLPLIAYTAATGAAVWVECRAKSLRAVPGWIASHEGTIYHSEKSREDAARGATRKASAEEREAARARKNSRAERRARLVVRLCRGAVATVSDAIAAGYCQPGIRAWQERNGIGDTAPLADLVRTGDPMATRLALDLARKVTREATATA